MSAVRLLPVNENCVQRRRVARIQTQPRDDVFSLNGHDAPVETCGAISDGGHAGDDAHMRLYGARFNHHHQPMTYGTRTKESTVTVTTSSSK